MAYAVMATACAVVATAYGADACIVMAPVVLPRAGAGAGAGRTGSHGVNGYIVMARTVVATDCGGGVTLRQV